MPYNPNQPRDENGEWTVAGNAARKAAGLKVRLPAGLAGLAHPTPTDIARAEAPLPPEIIARQKQDQEEDGVGWRYLQMMALRSVPPPKGLSDRSSASIGQRQGNCYQYAGSFVLDHEGWTLVHGNLFPLLGPFMDMPYNHAWAEKGDLVFDGVFSKFYRKQDYYAINFPVDLRKYTQQEAQKWMLKKKIWGDWE